MPDVDAADYTPTATWRQLEVTGLAPCRRDCHTVVLYDGCMYVFGGWSDDQTILSDTQRFSFATREWQPVRSQGFPPAAREGHSAVVWGSQMIVFGGQGEQGNFRDCYSFSFDDLTWRYLDTTLSPNRAAVGPHGIVAAAGEGAEGSAARQGAWWGVGPPAQLPNGTPPV